MNDNMVLPSYSDAVLSDDLMFANVFKQTLVILDDAKSHIDSIDPKDFDAKEKVLPAMNHAVQFVQKSI